MENPIQERHSWPKLLLLTGWLLTLGLLQVVMGDDSAAINTGDPRTVLILKLSQVFGVLLIFILPALLVSTLWTKQRIHYSGLTTRPAMLTLVMAGLCIIAALPLINWLSELNQQMQLPASMKGLEAWMKSSEEKAGVLTEVMTKGTSVSDLLLNLFVIAFMAALSEELFFRGLLQKVAIECFKNRHAGIWFSAILFSAFHMQFYGFLPRMLMGAYLGYLFLWSGSLWPGILAHFLNNGTAVFLVWLANRGTISTDADTIGSGSNEFIYVLCSALIVTGSIFLIYKKEGKARSVPRKKEL